MKNLLTSLFIAILCTTVYAQETVEKLHICEAVYEDAKAFPDFSESYTATLESSATISGYNTSQEAIKITGIVFKADGITPAENVVVNIEHANSEGEYEIHTKGDNKHVTHSASVKTNSNGEYTFYSFVPGHTKEKLAYRRTKRAQHIHITVKEPGKTPYELPAFVFDSDWMVNKAYKKRLERKGFDVVLTAEEIDGVQVATKNITLKDNTAK